MTSTSSSSNIPKYSFLEEDNSSRRSRKKNLLASFSQKIQKKITKGIVKNFIEPNGNGNAQKLITSTPGNNSSNIDKFNYFETTKNKRLSARERKLREIQEKKEKEEERERTLKRERKNQLLLPPIPPRSSSHPPPPDDSPKPNGVVKSIAASTKRKHIPVPLRGSSSHVDIKLLKKEYFENFTLSRSLPNIASNEKNIKRTSSDITPTSSKTNSIKNDDMTSTSTDLDSSYSDISKSNSECELSSSRADFSLSSDSSSDSSQSEKGGEVVLNNEPSIEGNHESTLKVNNTITTSAATPETATTTTTTTTNNNSDSNSNNKLKKEDKGIENGEKTFDGNTTEKLENSIIKENKEKEEKEEKEKNINPSNEDLLLTKSQNPKVLIKTESEEYMDTQLKDLWSNYYKNNYYGRFSSSGSGSESEGIVKNNIKLKDTSLMEKISEEEKQQEIKTPDDDNTQKEEDNKKLSGFNEWNDHDGSNIKDITQNKSVENDNENNDNKDSYSQDTLEINDYVQPFNEHSFIVKTMDSKHLSPKIITCPSDDPTKPVTHLVNISGVTIQTNDLAHLFWVPSYLHPELHPQEFKKWIDNNPNEQFGRRLSIRRTKSFAESARVITPDSTSENGDPVVDQVHINRNKTFSAFQRNNNGTVGSIYLKRSKNIRLKKSSSRGANGNDESLSFYNPEEDIYNKEMNMNNQNQNQNQNQNSTFQIDTIPDNDKNIKKDSLESSVEFTNKIDHDPNSLLDTDYADMDNPPLVGMPDAIYAYKENEIPPQKSGWLLWWSSFGKDDKKDSEKVKKSKKSNSNISKSFLPFFKSSPKSSSNNLAEKNNSCHQGKGITEAYILDGPLEFKPLTRPAEDAIFTLSHMKLATTYRPMLQQVHINNLMQRYAILYKEVAIKIPFKNRPQKKRRKPINNNKQKMALAKPKPKPKPKPKRLPVNGPLIKDFTIPKTVAGISPSSSPSSPSSSTSSLSSYDNRMATTKRKLIDYSDSKLNELLDKDNIFDNDNDNPKQIGGGKDKKNKKSTGGSSLYKNLNHSISLENISSNRHSNALQLNNKYSKSAISLDWKSPNHKKIEENTNSKLKLKTKSSSSLNHYHYHSITLF
ncbi:hypothetical protein LY90DRAFT_670683 [Neocallimastix californiae]|uniref:Protein Zds1 C-terminal domain-containing protein n=1 Tax=Neocallimastix californiae TaxID=1754190 RepID=A0A1Y2CUA9_9FUNG|nr:hypothetical protein LY90DRAFT_670683 [Neocallimastix californiae]|eukprot:ORY50613.1 hypothetical protein LY90DRAFT_670683 [Neocallimastix californiae]